MRPLMLMNPTTADVTCAWFQPSRCCTLHSRRPRTTCEHATMSWSRKLSIKMIGPCLSRVRPRQPESTSPSPSWFSSPTSLYSTEVQLTSSDGESRLNEDTRVALYKGDIWRALALLEQASEEMGLVVGNARHTPATASEAEASGDDRVLCQDRDNKRGELDIDDGSVGPAYARLIDLLWQFGHELEALEVFDLARRRVRIIAEAAAAEQGRDLRRKPQAGIPGLVLELPRGTCHGIMRAKLFRQDWQAVIEAMRASSRVPRRWSPGESIPGKLGMVDGTAAATKQGGVDFQGDPTGAKAGNWVPTEETYALALEACGRVQKRWGFKVALFLVQEMRDAKLDISLVHYRSAVLACSRTRQLAGVLPLLEEMRARGMTPDLETFNAAISSCTAEQVEQAVNLVQTMRSQELMPSEITYNILLRLCGLGGCWATGLELMTMMEDDGKRPTLHHYNSLFMALEHAERWREASNLFRKLRADGLRPNALAYGSLIGALDKCKKRQIAGAVLEEMLADSPRDSTRAYNLLLNACAKARKWEHAQKLFKEMGAVGVEKDMVTYNTVINALARCGRVTEATVHLHAMKEQGLSPDVVTFGTLIHACAMSARRHAALALFAEMVSRGMKPNLEAYKGCIVSCQKDKCYRQALEMFDAMTAQRIRPDRVVYNAVIACCAQLKLWRKAVALLDEMRLKDVNPDQYSYNSAIFACVKARQSMQMSMLMARMRDDGFSPDVWTYSNLIRCLGDAMLWRRAVSILDDMLLASQDKEQRSVKPDAHCFNGAIRACAKVGESDEAERLVNVMQTQGIKPDIYTYNSVMNSYAVMGDWVKALAMLDDMRGEGVKINSMTYSAAIKACDKGGQWERAVNLLNKMRTVDRARPNLFAYNHAMSACVRAGQPNVATDLLQKMKSEGLKMDRMTYGVVMFLHSRNGDWQECLRLNEQMEADNIQGDWYSYHALLVALSKGGCWDRALAMFDEMRRSSIVRPDASSYTTMLRVCEKAGYWEQALAYLRDMPLSGVRPTLMHFKLAIRACGNTGERAGSLGQEEADALRAGAASTVSEIFNMIRQNDMSPDADCYAFATRTFHLAGIKDPEAELVYGMDSQAAAKRLERPPEERSPHLDG